MFTPATILGFVLLYMGLLFLVGRWGERTTVGGRKTGDHPLIYSLSLAIYCTSWTYYGSIGSAATSGMFFLTIYLGPTLVILLWWKVLRKLIRLKESQRITSIADFLAARYGKSQAIAALATVIALVGAIPYIALQLKAIIATFGLIADGHGGGSLISAHIGPIVVGLMILFTIGFGVRRLDPTERHPGIVVVVAAESLVKLVTFLAVGIFVTWSAFGGLGALLRLPAHALPIGGQSPAPFTWLTSLILSMSAILFLPRQFHIAVVENSDENHLRTAMWLFPLYMLLINFFVYPLARGGLLAGLPAAAADTFLLRLPLHFGQEWLALAVFIGGFSAATGMVMISAMTLATMFTNHLLLPAIGATRRLGFLRRRLLQARWAAVALVLLSSYGFELIAGSSYSLVGLGIISFAAALQLAPSILLGLFWAKGNRIGALLGLAAGFLIWGYTVIVPSFVRGGRLPESLLTAGPAGLSFLRPEQLFGLSGLDPVSHAVVWTMVFNLGLYIAGSLLFEMDAEERRQALSFVGVLSGEGRTEPDRPRATAIDIAGKRAALTFLLAQYFPPAAAAAMFDQCLARLGLPPAGKISVIELADLCNEIEKQLAGAVGTAAAHAALKRQTVFSPAETQALQEAYTEILAGLSLTPGELKRKVDYHREREQLVLTHAAELAEKVVQLNEQIRQRTRTEGALRQSQDQLRHLSGSIMAAQERERRAIARELHDELGQVLTVLRLDSAWLSSRLEASDPKAAERGAAMRRLIDKTIDEVRSIAIRLRPGALDELGLVEALEWLSADFERRNEAVCIFTCDPLPPLPDPIATAAYRITQEALTNAARHARASQVEIGLRIDGRDLALSIVDNGRGFDPDKLKQAAGMGIAGMQERAALLGGSVSIRSAPGAGTAVFFRLPVQVGDGVLCYCPPRCSPAPFTQLIFLAASIFFTLCNSTLSNSFFYIKKIHSGGGEHGEGGSGGPQQDPGRGRHQ